MGCIGKAFWGLIGIGICGMYIVFCVVHGGWKYCALVLGCSAVATVLVMIAKLIMKIVKKNPVFTGKKAIKLEEAKQQDEANALANQNNKASVDAQWNANKERRAKEIDAYLPSLQKEFEELKEELDEKVAEIDDNHCLGEDEKNIQIIEMLIYFIESRRADSIKEALHEYDKAMTNKQMVSLEEKRLAMQREQMEKEASDRKKLLALQEEANDRARWAAMDNARQRDQMIEKLSSIQSVALSEYYKNL